MQQINLNLTKLIKKHISRHFYEVFTTDKRNIILAGGRSSTKSSIGAYKVVLTMMSDPLANAIVLQKTYNSMRDSSYAELAKVIERLGFNSLFEFMKSPLKITYKPTGCSIHFRSLDDYQRLKGFTTSKGYLSIIWMEEASMLSEADIKGARDTFLRSPVPGGITTVYSYNPPRGTLTFINQFTAEKEADHDWLVNRSTYLDVKRGFLSKAQLAEIELIKEREPLWYAHEYLGQIVEGSMQVYSPDRLKFMSKEEFLQKYEILYVQASCDPGYGVSGMAVGFYAVCCERGFWNPYRVTMSRHGEPQFQEQTIILIKSWYFDPQKEQGLADANLYLNAIDSNFKEIEREYNCRIDHDIIIDSADRGLRNYIMNHSRYGTVGPRKRDKVELIERSKELLAQDRFYILDESSNQLFYRQMVGYSWGDQQGQFSDNPKPIKIDDHHPDQFQYYCDVMKQNIQNHRNYTIAKQRNLM